MAVKSSYPTLRPGPSTYQSRGPSLFISLIFPLAGEERELRLVFEALREAWSRKVRALTCKCCGNGEGCLLDDGGVEGNKLERAERV